MSAFANWIAKKPAATYELVRARRKTLEISILPDASIRVRAPLRLSLVDIEAFISQKSAWIREKQEEQKRGVHEPTFEIQDGAELFWQGERHILKLEHSLFTDLQRVNHEIILRTPNVDDSSALRSALLRWIVAQSKKAIEERFQVVFNRFPAPAIPPGKLRVRHLRSRWGSCSPNGDVSLHAGLIHYPPLALDYVLAHEIAHLTHRNHKKRFYALLDRSLPHWQIGRSHLKGKFEPNFSV